MGQGHGIYREVSGWDCGYVEWGGMRLWGVYRAGGVG